MKQAQILEKLKKITEVIYKHDYPETYKNISDCVEEDFTDLYTSEYRLASILTCSDVTKVFHPLVATLVKGLLKSEIKKGNSSAACDLGALYYTGRIGKQSYRKAVKYYKLAAEAGDIIATENLGYCYYYGRDMAIDYEMAFKCFAYGAFNGRLISLYKIGDMYKNGYYVSKSISAAFNIYSRCLKLLKDNDEILKERLNKAVAECGADIHMRVADCYYQGLGTATDYEKAFRHFQRAAFLFRIRLSEGDFLIKKCYEHCVLAQTELSQRINGERPTFA